MTEKIKAEETLSHEKRVSLAAEFWDFIKHNKKYWLLPIIIVILGLGLLVLERAQQGGRDREQLDVGLRTHPLRAHVAGRYQGPNRAGMQRLANEYVERPPDDRARKVPQRHERYPEHGAPSNPPYVVLANSNSS